MFEFNYKYSDHLQYLQELAKALNVSIENNMLYLPGHLGSGYIRATELANGLQVLVNEVVINESVKFIRQPSTQSSYTLRFDEILNVAGLTIEMDKDVIEEQSEVYSGVSLTNSLYDLSYTAPAGTQNRCVNIYFTEEWLEKNFGIKSDDETLAKYLSLKTAVFDFEVLNFGYRELMEDIFLIRDELPMQKVVQQNRVMLLMEKFFKTLFAKIAADETRTLSEDTVKRIVQVESLLVKDLSILPPTIPVLAKAAMMSETKLKNSFKQLYGHSIYEYYQKCRMLKARQLLRSRRLSIKEIGLMLGFQNLSNFSIAYKKEFKMLPSDV
ncbi:MAG: helix-turn-helix transcriptional regulator [Ferruginibacter sp.]